MKKTLSILISGLLLVLFCVSLSAGQESETEETYTVWFGGHYTDFTDYQKKVGEYMLGNEEFLPELMVDYLARGKGYILTLNGHYYDHKNFRGTLTSRVGDRFKGTFGYNSLYHREGQDMLTYMETREAGGGKILTHEVLDPGADYRVHRQEFQSEMKALLSRKNNITLMAAHRMVLQKGAEQSIGNTHCFSCHVTSQTATVDKVTHQVEASLQGDIGKNTIGYDFGYRLFESVAQPVYAWFDEARHPVNGLSGAEFDSRLIYADTALPINAYPKTEKFQHKLKTKGSLGNGEYAASAGYSRAENKGTELVSTAWSGHVNYSHPLNQKSRLIARIKGVKLDSDDLFIDLPTYREGRGPTASQRDFDFTRYSTLNRSEFDGSLELITRVNPRLTASFLLGYENISRKDYPVHDDGINTNRFSGQLKLRYRKGLTYSTSVKYRYEKTSDPFTSGRGLFEARGDTVLNPIPDGFNFVFYWQREDLRYQAITTEPTQEHIFEWNSQWRPTSKMNVSLGLKGSYDKNGDLDSLDVNHLNVQPYAALNLTPNPNWSFMAGGSFIHYKSRGPVAVALFDG